MTQEEETKDKLNKDKENESTKLNTEYSNQNYLSSENYTKEYSLNMLIKNNYFSIIKFSFIIIFVLQILTLNKVLTKKSIIEQTPLILRDNYIIATYKFHKGEDMDVLYPAFVVYLSDYDYSIYLIEDNFVPQFKKISNGEKSTSTGIKKFKIEFKFFIDSMQKMFYRSYQLLKVDFSHLISEKITTMEMAFSNCYNLLDVNFTNFFPINLNNTERAFENCKNLTGIDLSTFTNKKIKKLKKMNFMFLSCDSLTFVNLSNIDIDLIKYKKNMFVNCSHLKLVILDSNSNVKNFAQKVYTENDTNHFAIISNEKDLVTTKINYNCETGEKEKCLTCNTDIRKKFQCDACNPHYFIPTVTFPTKCKKCLLPNCYECLDEYNCAECNKNYFLNKNKQCIEICNENIGCSKCDTSTNKCKKCDLGFYMPSDSLFKNNCKKCSIPNCKKCKGNNSTNICEQCHRRFTPIYENETIIACEAYKYGFYIDSSTGLDMLNYYIKAVYHVKNIGKKVKIINDTSAVTEMLIDNVNVTPTKKFKFYSVGLHTVYMNLNMSKINNTNFLFYNCRNLKEIEFSTFFKTDKIESMISMFSHCIKLEKIDLSVFNTKNVKDMSYMFYDCRSLISLDISNFNTKNTLNISGMFYQCENLINIIGLNNINTKNIIKMDNLFHDCKSLQKIDISNFKLHPNVSSIAGFFYGCESLKSIDLSNLKTTYIKNMDSMFFQCSSLTEINLSNFDTRNVQMMGSMFYNCSKLKKINITNFNTQNLNDMSWMFSYCSSLEEIDLSKLVFPKVDNLAYLFFGCSSLVKIDITSLKKNYYSDIQGMLYGINEKGYIRIFHEIYDEIENQVGMSWIKEVTVDHDEK